ncbi:hypothetical protein MG5_03187 [Candida albicans P57072]|nr:hypothetical protein MG5_03187 [Candida albicans P57072]KHC35462.1 hypothetical protein MGO_03144 [Candida albicans P76055]KHC36282.1 hypothetical protein MGQ_03156 [Candida albicans P76067]
MVLSTRVSIQWPPKEAEEKTSTLALTTPANNYVDIRVFKTQYPCLNSTLPLPFTQVFELGLAGKEIPLDNDKIKFDNYISTLALQQSIESGLPIFSIDVDIGHFSNYGLDGDRKETGEMKNSEGIIAPYIEIWRSLDPLKHTPQTEVRENTENEPMKTKIKMNVFTLKLMDHLGVLIRIGNWIQGIIQEGNSIHVIRSWYNENLQQWCNLIEYGNSDAFPIQFNGDIDDVVKVRNGWKWKCIERE